MGKPGGMALALGSAAFKLVGGAIQGLAGRKILKNTKLPEYQIPDQFKANVGLGRDIRTMGGMPSAQYQTGLMDISRSATFGVQALQGRRAATAGISSVVQRMMDAQSRLNNADATMAQRNRIVGTQMEMGANRDLAGQYLAKQSWEKFNPFMRRINEGQALLGAGIQNMTGALGDAAQVGMMDSYVKNQPGNEGKSFWER